MRLSKRTGYLSTCDKYESFSAKWVSSQIFLMKCQVIEFRRISERRTQSVCPSTTWVQWRLCQYDPHGAPLNILLYPTQVANQEQQAWTARNLLTIKALFRTIFTKVWMCDALFEMSQILLNSKVSDKALLILHKSYVDVYST